MPAAYGLPFGLCRSRSIRPQNFMCNTIVVDINNETIASNKGACPLAAKGRCGVEPRIRGGPGASHSKIY